MLARAIILKKPSTRVLQNVHVLESFTKSSTQPVFTCSKSTMETPEQCLKPAQL